MNHLNPTQILSLPILPSGCILAELYTGYPLFPGENEVEQLACIMEVLQLPPHHLLIAASRRRLFFGKYCVHPMENSLLHERLGTVGLLLYTKRWIDHCYF